MFLNSWAARWLPARTALGLDIGPSSVKLVELGRDRSGAMVLHRAARQSLQSGWVVDGQVESLENVAAAVRNLVRRCGTPCREAVLALPVKSVILRRARFRSGMPAEELDLHVQNEAAGFIPFPVEELALDYGIVDEPSTPLAPGEIEVLMAAARRDRVLDRVALAEAAGLRPVVMEVESNATQLALNSWLAKGGAAGATQTVALVEMGYEALSFRVFRGEAMLFERESPFGARRLVERVARDFGMSEEEARERQMQDGLPERYRLEMLPEHVAQTAGEIGRALQFFYAASPHHRVRSLLLAGGMAGLPDLVEQLSKATGVAVQRINPFEYMQQMPDAGQGEWKREAHSYLLACGLALRRWAS